MSRTGTKELAAPDVAVPADRLFNPQLMRLLGVVVGTATSFYLLLSVVPLYVAAGGSSGSGAGLAMGALMLGTVLTELVVPRLLSRYGYATVLASGAVLLGVPAALLVVSSALPFVLVVSLARGAGLAMIVVAGTALAAELAPCSRRSEALAVYGVAFGAPGLLALPLGVYLSSRVGFGPLLIVAAGTSLLGLLAVPGLPGRADRGGQRVQIFGGLRQSGLIPPTLVFTAVTIAVGVVVTFLPLAVASDQHWVVGVGLFAQAAAVMAARWMAGRYGDRHSSAELLVPALLLTSIGVGALVFDNAAAIVGAMVLFGLGFGAAQNATLALMYERARETEYARVSAVWNLAYDAGMGIGAIAFGAVVGSTGYALGFALTAIILVVAVLPARRQPATDATDASEAPNVALCAISGA